jgi:hypothetical protein
MNDMYPRVVADPTAPKPGLMERVRDFTITGERRVEPFNFSTTVSPFSCLLSLRQRDPGAFSKSRIACSPVYK